MLSNDLTSQHFTTILKCIPWYLLEDFVIVNWNFSQLYLSIADDVEESCWVLDVATYQVIW